MNIGLWSSAVLCGGLFFIMTAILAGFLRSHKKTPRAEAEISESVKLTMSSVFALLGLLIAFTFSNAHTRLQLRRQLIVQEANAISTAYFRLDLLPPAQRSSMQKKFRDYVDLRTAYYTLHDVPRMQENMNGLQALQKSIWADAIAATVGPANDTPRRLLLTALNSMFDVTTDRIVALQTHMPGIILLMLILLPLLCAVMLGHNSHSWRQIFYSVTFSLVICFALYVIMDIDHPRRGFVRLDQAEQQMENLRVLMKEELVP